MRRQQPGAPPERDQLAAELLSRPVRRQPRILGECIDEGHAGEKQRHGSGKNRGADPDQALNDTVFFLVQFG